MKNHNSQQYPDEKNFGSSPEVTASPFNSVKLELGFAIIIGVIVWLTVDFITPSIGKQLMLLSGYGVISATWLIIRIRQIAKRHHPESD